MTTKLTAMLAGLLLSLNAWALLPTTPEEYMQTFAEGLQIEKEKAAESLGWSGLSSPQIYDPIEQELLANLPAATSKATINYVGWLTKSLAYSGDSKYVPTLKKVALEAPHNKSKKYAQQALQMLPQYARYNSLISPEQWPDAPYPSLHQRYLNMLQSQEYELIRLAAKRIHNTLDYSPELLAQLDQTLNQYYIKPDLSSLGVDAIAWVAKALAGSRAPEYRDSVEKAAKKAPHKKLRTYAQKYLKYYN